MSHMNAERAAVPEPAVLDLSDPVGTDAEAGISNIGSEGPGNWLRKVSKREEKRQLSPSGSISFGSGEDFSSNIAGSESVPVRTGRVPAGLANIGSQGPSQRLGTAKREIEEREASAEASPKVTLDVDYVPPALEIGVPTVAAPL